MNDGREPLIESSEDYDNIRKSVSLAARELLNHPERASQVLASVERFQPYGEYSGVPLEDSRLLTAEVCGLTAECHKLLGQIEESAAWFRLAVQRSQETVCSCGYARLVVENQMKEHSRCALEAFTAYRQKCISRSIVLRTLSSVLSVIFPRHRGRMLRWRKSDEELLRRLIWLVVGTEGTEVVASFDDDDEACSIAHQILKARGYRVFGTGSLGFTTIEVEVGKGASAKQLLKSDPRIANSRVTWRV